LYLHGVPKSSIQQASQVIQEQNIIQSSATIKSCNAVTGHRFQIFSVLRGQRPEHISNARETREKVEKVAENRKNSRKPEKLLIQGRERSAGSPVYAHRTAAGVNV